MNIIDKSPIINPLLLSKLFKFNNIDESQLHKNVMALENKFSTGIDDVPISVVKQTIRFLSNPLLTHIINSCLISGFFPDKLKIAKVIPMFKKGCLNDPTSYTPISLLPVHSKIFEKVVYYQLLNYLEEKELIEKQHHGFRPGRSTITAGINFVHTIINSINR